MSIAAKGRSYTLLQKMVANRQLFLVIIWDLQSVKWNLSGAD
jgi:hypothetical protein